MLSKSSADIPGRLALAVIRSMPSPEAQATPPGIIVQNNSTNKRQNAILPLFCTVITSFVCVKLRQPPGGQHVAERND